VSEVTGVSSRNIEREKTGSAKVLADGR